MKPEQAQERLEEIRCLLFERERRALELSALDAQIAELAGIRQENKKTVKRTSSKDFASAFGRT